MVSLGTAWCRPVPHGAEEVAGQVEKHSFSARGTAPGQVGASGVWAPRRWDGHWTYGFFVTDDREAARLATTYGVAVVTTWRLLLLAHRKGWIDDDALWDDVRTLRANGRGIPPGVHDRAAFAAWLKLSLARG